MKNYRPISLLFIFYKLFTKIINHPSQKFDFYQSVNQAGFRRNFSTTDHIQVIHTLIEKCTESNVPLQMAFTGYQKVFDSIEPWAITQVYLESIWAPLNSGAHIDSKYTNLI